jgi:hypothetical protein
MTRTRMAVSATAALAAVHLVAVVLSLDDPNLVRWVHDVAGWVASIFGAFGAVVAARTFSRGDYLRKVWALMAAGAVLLVLGHAIRSVWEHSYPDVPFNDSPLIYTRMLIIAGSNTVNTWGLILLAYSYTHSGLDVPRTATFNALWVAASAIALALMARSLQHDLSHLETARRVGASVTNIASTLGDTANIILIAPILRVAYLMRGGRLAGAWWAIGLSGALWLIYDCKYWIAEPLPFDPARVNAVLVTIRNPALALVGLAGLLHREAVVAGS